MEQALEDRPQAGDRVMPRDERLEFVQSLAGDILSRASGSTDGGEHLKRFDGLSALNRLAVRNLLHGLCQYGCAESESELRILKDWWTTCPK